MRIAQIYSHLNGLEFMLVRKPDLWQEIQDAVKNVDASNAFDNVSKEKFLYSPAKINQLFKAALTLKGWHESQTDYFVKDNVAIEIQLGKYFAVQYDLHIKHTFFYERGDIDIGIEIIPMHSLMSQMSSGVAWYENELTNIVREGRSNPSVPLILAGIEP